MTGLSIGDKYICSHIKHARASPIHGNNEHAHYLKRANVCPLGKKSNFVHFA